MKFLYDLFPIILFFISYHQADTIISNTAFAQWIDPSQPEQIAATIVATSIAIVASFIQVAGYWLKTQRIERMHLISLALISVLGSITIVLGNPAFIQWKPTVLNWVFAGVFFASQYYGEKNLAKRMMGAQIELPDLVWTKLNLSWVAFFIVSGAANLYVAFFYGLDMDDKTRMDNWVNFKLFGLMGLTLVFFVGQMIYLARHIIDKPPEAEEK